MVSADVYSCYCPLVAAVCISQLKARMHQITRRQEVQNVIKVSHEKTVIRRLEKLLAA